MNVLLLIDSVKSFQDNNHLILGNALFRKGCGVGYGLVNSLAFVDNRYVCDLATLDHGLEPGESLGGALTWANVEDYDLIWVMSQPHPSIEKEVYQLLWALSARVQLVNSVEGLVFLNNKSNLHTIVPSEHLIPGHVANDFDHLWELFTATADRTWVVKPINEGQGADVYVLRQHDSNARVILQSMTGNAQIKREMRFPDTIGLADTYCVMQHYVAETLLREKRVLFCGGHFLGAYRRIHAAHEHRAHRMHGAQQIPVSLEPEEDALCHMVARNLLQHGVHFVGLDVAFPYILECNLVNPGGIRTLSHLTGKDYAAAAVDHLLHALQDVMV